MWRRVRSCLLLFLLLLFLLLQPCACVWTCETCVTPGGVREWAWQANTGPSTPALIPSTSMDLPGSAVFPFSSCTNTDSRSRPDTARGSGAGVLRAGRICRGRAVFQPAVGAPVAGTSPSHTRVRRSWIWNQFFVIEEYSGPEPVLIGRLHSSMDRGDGRTKYILTGEGAGSVFVIDGKTGNIHVTKPLDREEKDQYRLIATATDRQTGQALEASSQFVIRVQDINDNSPVFPQGHYSATVPEMSSIGTSVIQVTATDADDHSYGNSAKLVYSLLQGQQYFTVDPQSGVLRTAVSDMDREVQPDYTVVLQARDMGGHQGGLTGTTSITVHLTDVNDNPPRFTNSVWSFSVSELALPGVEVGRVSATDTDLGENARLDFTITDGDGGDTFNITGLNQEGVIFLNKVVDYERRSSYTLAVEVQNPSVEARFAQRGAFKDRAVVRINVMNADEPPLFSRSRYRLDVVENCLPACAVGRISAVDPDTGLSSNIKYSIDPESDPEALFRIAPDNGLITTAIELDREHEKWHNITVIATQRDSPNQVTRVAVAIETLDLNDNAPELDRQYSTAVCDSSTPGQVIQVIRAVDRDQGSHSSPVHFSLPRSVSLPLNLTLRDRGDHTASLVLQSPLKPLPPTTSSHIIKIPIILRDGVSELSSTGTVTVAMCPCRGGRMRTEELKRETDEASGADARVDWERRVVCVPQSPVAAPLGLSSLATLAALGCSSTLLVVAVIALSMCRQKSDPLSPVEDEEIRENIITYDDEGGGEADTAAFDMATLKSAPPSTHMVLRLSESRNICSGYIRTRSSASGQPRPGSAALYSPFSYSMRTLPMGPVVRLTTLACAQPPRPDHAPRAGTGERCQNMDQSRAVGPGDDNVKESSAGIEVISECQNQSQEQSASSDLAPVLHSSNWSDSSQSGAPPPGFPTHHTSTSTITSTVATDDTTPTTASHRLTEAPINTSQSTAPYRPPQPLRTMEGTLLKGSGGIPLAGTTCLYPEASELVGVYALAGRDYAQRLFTPFPGGSGVYMGGWGLGRCEGAGAGKAGSNSLTHRMGDFLQHRLAQVTYDPMQPPYDSLQTYGLEGAGSQATSLSSLESEGEREMEDRAGVDEWGPKFQKLLEIIRDRERETEDKMMEKQERSEDERNKEEEREEEKGLEQGMGEETEGKKYRKQGDRIQVEGEDKT